MPVNSIFKDNTVNLTNYGFAVTKVDASSLTKGITIIGNEKANSIKGDFGNDTISGSSGNDILFGGAVKMLSSSSAKVL